MIQNQMVATKKTHISRRLIRNHEPLKKKKKIYSVNNIPYFLENRPMGVYFSKAVFTERIFEWAYIQVGLYSRCILC